MNNDQVIKYKYSRPGTGHLFEFLFNPMAYWATRPVTTKRLDKEELLELLRAEFSDHLMWWTLNSGPAGVVESHNNIPDTFWTWNHHQKAATRFAFSDGTFKATTATPQELDYWYFSIMTASETRARAFIDAWGQA